MRVPSHSSSRAIAERREHRRIVRRPVRRSLRLGQPFPANPFAIPALPGDEIGRRAVSVRDAIGALRGKFQRHSLTGRRLEISPVWFAKGGHRGGIEHRCRTGGGWKNHATERNDHRRRPAHMVGDGDVVDSPIVGNETQANARSLGVAPRARQHESDVAKGQRANVAESRAPRTVGGSRTRRRSPTPACPSSACTISTGRLPSRCARDRCRATRARRGC